MTTENPDSPILTSEGLSRLVNRVGTIAGSIVGFATLAFAGGFLAQRAQYDFAQVPFVFVDYWSYAEIGLMAFVRSIYALVEWPWAVGLIAVSSVALVLLVEFETFRRIVLRPPLVFLSYTLVLIGTIVVIGQQLEVRTLRSEAPASTKFSALGVARSAGKADTVPAIFPFQYIVSSPLNVPGVESLTFPKNAVEAWNEIADELEMQLDPGAQYQDLRPPQAWALAPKRHVGAGVERRRHLLGQPVAAERLDANRAAQLYRSILSAFVVLLWLFFVNRFWLERIRAEVLSVEPPVPSTPLGTLTLRLREEVWFASKWVLRPLAALLLITSGVFLMPECFGILSMARIGQEYVQIITHTDRDNGPSAVAGLEALKDPQEVTKLTEEGLSLLQDCPVRNALRHRQLSRHWDEIVRRLEEDGSPAAAKALERLASASGAVAPEFVNVAQDAWARVSARTSASFEGYILYYPRSETDYLRLLRRAPLSPDSPWAIYPVAMSSIVDIRLKRDAKTLRLIELLRGMASMSADQRMAALIDAEHLGHARLLEVAIAATFDPDVEIRAPSITDVGRYAATLPPGEASELRRAIATRRLLEILQDRSERRSHRGASVTALSRFVLPGDEYVCDQLHALVSDPDTLADPDEARVAGSIVSTLGELRCTNAAPTLTRLLLDQSVPDAVRLYIPTTLGSLGEDDMAAQALAQIMTSENSVWLIRPTLGALSDLNPGDPTPVVTALCAFVSRTDYPPEMQALDLVAEYRHTAMTVLGRIGDRRALPTLIEVMHGNDSAQIRASAVSAAARVGDEDTESEFVTLFANKEEEEGLRITAVEALGAFRGEEAVMVLIDRYPFEEDAVQGAILSTLRTRAEKGSGLAETKLAELLAREQEELGLFGGG